MSRSVIVSAKRTAMGRFMGTISRFPAPQLGTEVAKAVLAETKALDGGRDGVEGTDSRTIVSTKHASASVVVIDLLATQLAAGVSGPIQGRPQKG